LGIQSFELDLCYVKLYKNLVTAQQRDHQVRREEDIKTRTKGLCSNWNIRIMEKCNDGIKAKN